MSDPFNTELEQVKYWRNKYDQEFERAKSYEMDLVYADFRIRELQREVAKLASEKKELEKDINILLITEGAKDADEK